MICAIAAIGQTGGASSPPATPQYLVGIGGGYDRYASPPAGALISFAARIRGNLYSWSTLDTPIAPASTPGGPTPASIRTGAAYIAGVNGSAYLFVLGDAGLATGSGTAALGSFSGGGGVLFKVGKWYMGPVVRALKVSSTAVQPVVEAMAFISF